MTSERLGYLSRLWEMHLLVTNLLYGEKSHSDSVRSETISNEEQNDRDFLTFETTIPAILGATENIGDMDDAKLKSEDNGWKLQHALEDSLRTFGARLPTLTEANTKCSSSCSKLDESIHKIHRYGESILTTGSLDREVQNELLPESEIQWREGVIGLTKVNEMVEKKLHTKYFERLEGSSSKASKALIDAEPIDLPLDNLFYHLVSGTCHDQGHGASLKLSGWEDIKENSVFHMFLSPCETVKGCEASRCYTSCTLERHDAKSHGGDLNICEETQEAEVLNIPLWLSFNHTNMWLASTKGLEIISREQRENRSQIPLEQLMQQRQLKTSDIHLEVKKFHLAYRLVCSLRHLYLGSWIQQDLTLKNIFVMNDPKATIEDILAEPYINCLLQTIPRNTNTVINDFNSGKRNFSRFFLSLAQVLIDIFKGEIGRYDYGSDLKTWYDDLSEEAQVLLKDDLVQHYRKAVFSCLLFFKHYRVGVDKTEKTESGARRVILEHIVAPLRTNLDIWEAQVSQCGKPPTQNIDHGAHRALDHRPALPTFTLFSDEDDRNEMLKSNQLKTRSKHDFSTRMDRFVERYILRVAEVDIPAAFPHERVKVVIIDTGFCPNDDPFFIHAEQRVRNCRSFIGKEADWNDIHGHGTHVARLVLRYAPECEVYVAKVSDTRSFSEDQVGRLAKALEWAGEQADIINLSFGLGQQCPSPQLKQVLDKLVLDRKLIFAAASNSGGNRSRPWPANHPGVFCIHVTNERAVPNLNMNPVAKSTMDNFATLGENIQSYWQGEERCISGTSFATPVAAAIAANILEFARRNLRADEANALQAYGPMLHIQSLILLSDVLPAIGSQDVLLL
ncbi:subtilisin [Fusarium subglutinans]|uniref:Subtilisin n=1 Tax=Gibberella subglutinans TaxID=42677 RepID=A0A8H5PC22_GIBSU|nr:subtilisin [Fusarium subglutinans]KAF5593782.1 subtilisin [Fusarium subglutinans]